MPAARPAFAPTAIVLAFSIVFADLSGDGLFAASQDVEAEIFGRVTSCATGLPIPQTTISISSPRLLVERRFVTGTSGRFAVSGILPGVYAVRFRAAGFATGERRDVELEAGVHRRVDYCLSPNDRGRSGETSLSWDGPRVDTTNPTVAFSVSRAWLERVPIGREDPVAAMLPVLTVAREGDGGALEEGAIEDDEGVIEGIRVEQATMDVSRRSGGMRETVTRATGSNRFGGTARVSFADHRLQSDNLTPSLAAQGVENGRPLRRVTEVSVEAGVPARRDKTWIWASVSRTSADAGFVGRCFDLTVTRKADARLQHQWRRDQRTSIAWSRPSRFRPHFGATEYDYAEATSRQHSLGLARPLRIEHQWLPRDEIVVSSRYRFSDDGYALDFQEPRLAAVQPAYDRYTLDRWRSGSETRHTNRSHSFGADGSWFLPALAGAEHALSFGVELLSTRSAERDHTGGGVEAVFDSRSGVRLPWQARLFRDGESRHAASEYSAYVQDSLRFGRLTLQAGLRFDRQDDRALDAVIPANSLVPEQLPAVRFAGADSGVVYNDLSPRAGIAWDIAGDGRTVLKLAAASYNASGNSTSAVLQPTSQTRLVYWWNDADGDGFVQPGELDLARGLATTPSSNYDAAHPASVRTPASVDLRLKNIRAVSVSAGAERALARRVTLRLSYTARRGYRFQSSFPIEADGSPVASGSYYPVNWQPSACPPAARCPTVTYFQRDSPLPARTILRNDGEYSWRHSLDVVLHRRLSAGWMADAQFNWNLAHWHFPRPTRDYTDPTNVAARNGTEYGAAAPRWAVTLSSSVTLPWHLGAAAILAARQGLPFDRVVSSPNRGALGSTNVLIARYGSERYPAVARLDTRLEWRLAARGVTLVPSLNLLNALNSNVVLSRNRVQNSRTANNVIEIAAPRSLRLEASLSW